MPNWVRKRDKVGAEQLSGDFATEVSVNTTSKLKFINRDKEEEPELEPAKSEALLRIEKLRNEWDFEEKIILKKGKRELEV